MLRLGRERKRQRRKGEDEEKLVPRKENEGPAQSGVFCWAQGTVSLSIFPFLFPSHLDTCWIGSQGYYLLLHTHANTHQHIHMLIFFLSSVR